MTKSTARLIVAAFALLPGICRADQAGEALLQRCVEAEGAAQTLDARFTHQFMENGVLRTQTGTLRLRKPNLAHIVVVSGKQESTGNVIIHSDGSRFVTYSSSDNDYATEPSDMAGGNVARNNILETAIFFNPDQLNRIRAAATGVRVHGAVTVGGVACRVLEFAGIPNVTLRLYIGPDSLLRGAYKIFKGDRDETHLTGLKRPVELTRAAFRWSPPHGAKSVQEVEASMAAQAGGQQAVSLLPAGRAAPEFTLASATGGSVSLPAALKGHKALILNFWSYF
jgi:outer membrane lipoprotein-sorting protein